METILVQMKATYAQTKPTYEPNRVISTSLRPIGPMARSPKSEKEPPAVFFASRSRIEQNIVKE